MDKKKAKWIFTGAGVAIVVVWLFMIGLLVKKVSFDKPEEQTAARPGDALTLNSGQRDWMEIYLKGNKVGYSISSISPVEDNYIIYEEIFLKLNLLGQASGMHSITQSLVNHKFFLKNFNFRLSSGAVMFHVSGKVKDDLLVLQVGDERMKRRETIKLKEPPVIGSGITYFFKGRKLRVGESFKFPVFDPSTMSQRDIKIKVASRETLVINRMEYQAFRLDAEMWGQPMAFWLDDEGRVLKEKGFMGLTLVRSSAANAPRNLQAAGGDDFYEMAAIDPGKTLPRPERLNYLKLKVEGVSGTGFDAASLDKGRQRFDEGFLEVFKEKLPARAGWSIPYQDRKGDMQRYLKPELNIESDNEDIERKAVELAGDEKNPVTVARRIMVWVYRELEKRPVISVPSALEALKTKVGDCNEHAVLFTALLRACGIPARLCVGLVYTRGKFFYHAWTETYLETWVSMDPTLNQFPADVTHLKLAEGGLDRQVEIIGLIGKLKLTIVDYK